MVTLDGSTHTYYLDGQVIPGVTQTIDQLTSFAGIPPEVLEYASERGRLVHRATELYDNENLDFGSLDPVLVPYLDAWIKFKKESGFIPINIEQIVFHKRHRYAGTLDRAGILYDHESVLDIKAVAVLGDHTGVQLAGYQEAENSTRKKADHIRHRYAVQLKPDGTYRLRQYKDKADFSVFLSCLNLHNWRSAHA